MHNQKISCTIAIIKIIIMSGNQEYVEKVQTRLENRGQTLRVYGAGKFQEESLLLNKTQAAFLIIELMKFLDDE